MARGYQLVDYMFVLGEIGNTVPSWGTGRHDQRRADDTGLSRCQRRRRRCRRGHLVVRCFRRCGGCRRRSDYEVISNSNADLFAAATIDQVLANLTLDFADDAFGQADLVIRATDTNGLFVDTELSVNVNSVNDAPVIY